MCAMPSLNSTDIFPRGFVVSTASLLVSAKTATTKPSLPFRSLVSTFSTFSSYAPF